MTEHLNPSKLVERLKDKVDLDEEKLKAFNTELFSIIQRELKKKETFSIFGFGTFKRLPVEEAAGRNPQNGEGILIPAHFRIKFIPAAQAARRINAEFAHLKPIILEEDNEEHKSLLLKAEQYTRERENDDDGDDNDDELEEEFMERRAVEKTVIFSPPENEEIEEEKPEKKNKRKLIIILLLLLLLSGLGIFLFGRPSSSAAPAPEQKETPEKIQEEKPAAPKETAKPEQTPVPRPGTKQKQKEAVNYNIRKGDSFSKLARTTWGDLCLWPYLYSHNAGNYPDPDRLQPGNSIIIPPRPDKEKDQLVIEKSILKAYERYKVLIRQQPDSPWNARRKISAGNVLGGGEILYPGFLKAHKGKIPEEEIRWLEDSGILHRP
ncbi:hypothetical protein CSB45_15305 [candidate division KSB3 bacterium]|uniref:LysM domain-containing protein n=1 Tax=candidate division KSB3 bacterium TaxID=2044937 RepID=A0A2G6E0F1_9BACT|nr:MAG: hypothetical protein CSB45_15305 [candidate division KSB3 bacterium]